MTDRGIIVADASSLRRLQASIRQDIYEDGISAGKPIRRYLDLLSYLGENGFRVVVPEMVSMEMSSVLLGAPNIDDLFSDSRRNRESNDTIRALRTFLERTKSGKLAGVEIRPSSPASDHGQYLESLRVIAADPVMSRKRKCDLLAVAQKKDRRHFGERACLDAIEEMQDTPGGAGGTVFFLSDDRDALRECHERFGDQVSRLNASGFLGGIARTGLCEQLQFKPGTLNAMTRDLLDQEDTPQFNGGALVDNSRAPHEGNNYQFQQQMESLAAEMKVESATGIPGYRDAVPVGAASRLDKFRQKWGWNGRSRASPPGGGEEDTAPESTEAADDHRQIINVQFERKKSMELEYATSGKESSAYETYKESFGFQVYNHRNERKMTPAALAAEVGNAMQQPNAVDKTQIIRWEQALAVPDRDQYRALEKLLIDQNPAIKPGEKDEAKEIFAAAYKRSKEIIEMGTRDPGLDPQRYAFGTLVREYHDQLPGLSLEGMAKKLNERLKIEIADDERELLKKEPREFIGAIEAGVVHPSKGLAVALVSALDKGRELAEADKQKLYDTYEASKVQSRAPRSRASEAGPRKPRIPVDAADDQVTPEVSKVQSELVDFFREEGGKPNVAAVAAYARKDLGYGHGAASVIYTIMDESNTSLHRIRKNLSDTAKDMLTAYISKEGKPDEEIARFEAKFEELRKATGHRRRGRPESNLSVA